MSGMGSGRAWTMRMGLAVGMTASRQKPACANSAPNADAVRSRPPVTVNVGRPVLGDGPFDDEQFRGVARSAAYRPQDRDAFLVDPVVQHLHEQVSIGGGQRIDEEVTGH